MNIKSRESYIYFGGYEENKVENLVWMDVDGSHWNVFFENIFIEGEYLINTKKVEFTVDSGTSLFYLPEDKFEELGELLIKD